MTDHSPVPERHNSARTGLRAPFTAVVVALVGSLFSSAAPAALADPPSPVAAYSFDEGSGGTVEDSIGENNGAIDGATWTPNGKYGSALDFDGTNDLVRIADAAELDLTGEFTLEAWVRPDALANWSAPITKAEDLGSGGSGYLLTAHLYGRPAGVVGDSGASAAVLASAALPTIAWSHLALTSDGTTLRIYVNGELKAATATIAAPATDADLEIGHSELTNTYFDGLIDEVRLYDEALSESEIQADRDTGVTAPALRAVTTSVLSTGPSSELVSDVPIYTTWSPSVTKVVYSLPIPSIGNGEVLRTTGDLLVTNTQSYDATVSVRLVLGGSPSDPHGTVVSPFTSVRQTSGMSHWTLPINGVYHSTSNLGTRYLKIVVEATSGDAGPADTLTVEPNNGHLAVTRHTPASGPTSLPTHKVQPLVGAISESTVSVPVDSAWRSVLSRKVSNLAIDDILDVSGQLRLQNTTGTSVNLESKVVLATTPTGSASTLSMPTIQRLTPDMKWARVVYSNEQRITDPAKRYVNLLVRAVPVPGTSPTPLTVSPGTGVLNVLRFKPDPGDLSSAMLPGTRELQSWDGVPDVAAIPFAPLSVPEKRVAASVPLYGLQKGDIIRGRGLVTGDLAGGNSAQIMTELVLADSKTATTGETVAKPTGDSVPTSAQIHTIFKEGTYVASQASATVKHLNLVVYAGRAPAFPGESMTVPNASVSYSRSMPTGAFSANFEDGLLDQFFTFGGVTSVSSTEAREGTKALQVDLSSSSGCCGDPAGVRRAEVGPPDQRASGGHVGEDGWYGFSAYFPESFSVPAPDPTTTPDYFDGSIDEVRLYDEALSESQIQTDRDGEFGLGQVPVAAYSFDEGSGSTAGDSAGNNDGTIHGASWESTGKYGAALDFDGTDDLVSVADASELDFTDEFTLEAWVKPDTLGAFSPVITKGEDPGSNVSGYQMNAQAYGKPAGFVAHSGALGILFGPAVLPTDTWSHLAFTSDGATLRMYIDGELAATAPAIAAKATDADLTIGVNPLKPEPNAGTWNVFTQLHHTDAGLDCTTSLPPPIAFGARHWKAGAHTNPGATETATPVTGEYLEVAFNGGEINDDCTQVVDSSQYYVLTPLERGRWYDFVLHTRWTPAAGGPGNSVSEVWVDGEQMLGNLTTPVSKPTLFWHGTPNIHNTDVGLQFGLYRGPSIADPPSRLFIDSVRRGNSYSAVAPIP